MSSAGDACKQWASKAVAFVVKHSEAGIVSLCTNVAAIMEEQNRLAEENERLRRELQAYREVYEFPPGHESAGSRHPRRSSVKPAIGGVTDALDSSSELQGDVQAARIAVTSSTRKQSKGTIDVLRVLQQLRQFGHPWVPLDGCLCKACRRFEGFKVSPKALTFNLLDMGHTAIIRRKYLGKIRYIGHLDTSAPRRIWLGLELHVPVGFSDGSIGGKAYFECKPRHGAFFDVSSVSAVVV
ncbi:uncharacterized protein LOC144170392 isoform X2 [Haemaphysalis longicornis]